MACDSKSVPHSKFKASKISIGYKNGCPTDSLEVRNRFWGKVQIKGNDECWPWTAGKYPKGYGKFKRNGSAQVASRVAWELHNNALLGDRFACHTCHNPSCCNPNHIYAGDAQTNAADAKRAKRNHIESSPGEANPRSKLKAEQVKAIRKRISGGESNYDIAKDYPVDSSTISAIRHNRIWANT